MTDMIIEMITEITTEKQRGKIKCFIAIFSQCVYIIAADIEKEEELIAGKDIEERKEFYMIICEVVATKS